jgi:hypothetical protein
MGIVRLSSSLVCTTVMVCTTLIRRVRSICVRRLLEGRLEGFIVKPCQRISEVGIEVRRLKHMGITTYE